MKQEVEDLMILLNEAQLSKSKEMLDLREINEQNSKEKQS